MIQTPAAASLDHYTMSLDFLSSTPLMVSSRRPKLSLDISTSSNSPLSSKITPPSRFHKSPLTMRPHPSSLRLPSPSTLPYVLPLGSKSILRNGPLPRRIASATSARGSHRLFPTPKRVAFREDLIEFVPAPTVEGSSSEELNDSSGNSDDANGSHGGLRKAVGHGQKRRKTSKGHDEPGNKSSESPTRRHRPWKRSKDWIWTMGAWDDVQLYDSPEEGAPPMVHAATRPSQALAKERNDSKTKVEDFHDDTAKSLTIITSTTNFGPEELL